MESFQIFDHITDGVMALHREWKFQNINQTAARLLERRSADLLDREIWPSTLTSSDRAMKQPIGRRPRRVFPAPRPTSMHHSVPGLKCGRSHPTTV